MPSQPIPLSDMQRGRIAKVGTHANVHVFISDHSRILSITVEASLTCSYQDTRRRYAHTRSATTFSGRTIKEVINNSEVKIQRRAPRARKASSHNVRWHNDNFTISMSHLEGTVQKMEDPKDLFSKMTIRVLGPGPYVWLPLRTLAYQ